MQKLLFKNIYVRLWRHENDLFIRWLEFSFYQMKTWKWSVSFSCNNLFLRVIQDFWIKTTEEDPVPIQKRRWTNGLRLSSVLSSLSSFFSYLWFVTQMFFQSFKVIHWKIHIDKYLVQYIIMNTAIISIKIELFFNL